MYSALNKQEQKAARLILENPQKIIHDSITELANNSQVSDTTVFRLCQKLGYKGFQDLKINLALAVIEPIKNINEEINESDDMYIIMQKLLHQNLHNLEETIRINGSGALEAAVDLLLPANQLLFFGMAGSGALAVDACHKFTKTGIRSVVHTDFHWQVIAAALAGPGDVIIAISNSGSNKEIIESLRLARKNQAKIITVTGNAISPIAKVSDVLLVSYAKGDMFRSEAAGSRITALMLIDCLTLAVSLKRKDETLQALRKVREGIALTRY